MANLPGVKQFSQLYNEVGNWACGSNPSDTTNPTNPGLAQTKQLVNDAYREVVSQRRWNFLFNVLTFTLVANQTSEYKLDDTCDTPLYFSIPAEAKKLAMLPYQEWKMRYPAGYTNMAASSPIYYIPSITSANAAKQILLYPASDSSARVVEYGFIKRITDLSADADTMIIPAEWQDVVIKLAEAKAFGKRQDQANEQKYMALYNQRLAQMMIWDNQYAEWVDGLMDLAGSRVGSVLGNFNQVAWSIGTGGIY